MPKVLIDGTLVDVPDTALFADDGQTVLTFPNGPFFTAEDLERVRSEEKDKLYGRIDGLTATINGLKEQVGGLTAEEQRAQAQAEAERTHLEAEAKRKEEEELDAKSLIARREQEWQATLTKQQEEWNTRFEDADQKRVLAEAAAQKEREFNDLKGYAQAQVKDNEALIAPQLLPWIGGNSREEIDATVARAIETTNSLTEEMQAAIGTQIPQVDPTTGLPVQVVVAPPAPPATPGTRVTAAPGTDPGAPFQTLTPEQIKNMPMDQYAKLRGTLGIGGQSQNRGLYG